MTSRNMRFDPLYWSDENEEEITEIYEHGYSYGLQCGEKVFDQGDVIIKYTSDECLRKEFEMNPHAVTDCDKITPTQFNKFKDGFFKGMAYAEEQYEEEQEEQECLGVLLN